MPESNRYPNINIRSKTELARRISGKNFTRQEALNLINKVSNNFDKYWHDNKSHSEPEKDKYVRSAKGTHLGNLLSLINRKVLAPYDYMVPNFIFGGVAKKSHVQATYFLLGQQRKRTKLGLDISRFFEQNNRDRVYIFFHKKCGCGAKVSHLLADLCCVSEGPKNNSLNNKVLARGFSTSTRLALWCNLDLFLRIFWKTNKLLKNKNPKIAIFVDDIGITASKTKKETMELLAEEIENIFSNIDSNHCLPLNPDKKDIQSYLDNNMEHLGLKLGRSKLSIGKKGLAKQSLVEKKLRKKDLTIAEKKQLLNQKKSRKNYVKYINKVNAG